MAVNIHITIIELNALHTKRQNLFQELDAVIHLLMEAKHWGLRKSRNATSLNSRFKSLDTLKEIGRASCRERVWGTGGAAMVKKVRTAQLLTMEVRIDAVNLLQM